MEQSFTPPAIDAMKMLSLRDEMLHAQAYMERAQQAYWQAEAAFNSYVRWGDAVNNMGGQIPPSAEKAFMLSNSIAGCAAVASY